MNTAKMKFATIQREVEVSGEKDPQLIEIYNNLREELSVATQNFNNENRKFRLRKIWSLEKEENPNMMELGDLRWEFERDFPGEEIPSEEIPSEEVSGEELLSSHETERLEREALDDSLKEGKRITPRLGHQLEPVIEETLAPPPRNQSNFPLSEEHQAPENAFSSNAENISTGWNWRELFEKGGEPQDIRTEKLYVLFCIPFAMHFHVSF